MSSENYIKNFNWFSFIEIFLEIWINSLNKKWIFHWKFFRFIFNSALTDWNKIRFEYSKAIDILCAFYDFQNTTFRYRELGRPPEGRRMHCSSAGKTTGAYKFRKSVLNKTHKSIGRRKFRGENASVFVCFPPIVFGIGVQSKHGL